MEQNTPRLTDAQVQRLWEIGGYPKDQFEEELRRMGLIAEPVDPDLEEAEALHADWLLGKIGEHGDAIYLALAALRRGRELAKPLTREMVGVALGRSWEGCVINLERLHAALVEQMK